MDDSYRLLNRPQYSQKFAPVGAGGNWKARVEPMGIYHTAENNTFNAE